MESIIIARYIHSNKHLSFTVDQWKDKRDLVNNKGEKLWVFVRITKQRTTTTSTKPRKKGGCGCS